MHIITPIAGLESELAEEARQFEGMEGALIRHAMHERGDATMHSVSVSLRGRTANAECRGAKARDEGLEKKRADRRAAKQALYDALCALTGQTQPWGSLTGVRPTALLRSLAARGQEEDFVAAYGVRADRYALARRIVDAQDRAMANVAHNAVCVYIGVPFCVSRCSYCSFPGRVAKKGEMEAYVNALEREMDAAAAVLDAHGAPVAAIYIGGGTPTSLPLGLLRRILARMRRFGQGMEITLEAGRPDTLDADKLRAALDAGVNRLCINPQSMVDQTLLRIGRTHTARDVETSMALAKDAGFTHINMDVIAGLPHEDEGDFAHTLARVRALDPSSFTCHTLSLKRGSRLHAENFAHADAAAVARMVDAARAGAKEQGLSPYYLYRQKYMAGNLENVGYAKEGYACVYNIAMMDELRSVMALGVGSVGKLIAGDLIVRKPNPRDLHVYLARLDGILERKQGFFSVDKENAGDYNNENGDEGARETQ